MAGLCWRVYGEASASRGAPHLKTGIHGVGALGSPFGAGLSEAGHETWLLNRPGIHIDTVKCQGLEVVENAPAVLNG